MSRWHRNPCSLGSAAECSLGSAAEKELECEVCCSYELPREDLSPPTKAHVEAERGKRSERTWDEYLSLTASQSTKHGSDRSPYPHPG